MEIHPLYPNDALAQYSLRRGIAVAGYCPLAFDLPSHPEVVNLAREAGVTPAQALLRWQVQKGYVPVCKSLQPMRMRENLMVGAADAAQLSATAMAHLDGLSTVHGKRKVRDHEAQFGVPLDY